MMDVQQIQKLLPHRYPFLLVDRVVEIVPGQKLVAFKNVTTNEPFFNGHFPGHPVMPGALIVEALAQLGGVLLEATVRGQGSTRELHALLTIIERAKFRRPVSPGDQLRLEVEVKGWRVVPGMTAAKMQGYAFVGERRVAEAAVSCQLIDSSRGRASNDGGDKG